MEEKKEFKCEVCGRIFGGEEALAQHNAAKHSEAIIKKENKKPADNKKIRNWIISIIILGTIVAGFIWMTSGINNEDQACLTQPATEINIGGHTNLKLHIHADLNILIDGVSENIPANIGISEGIMRPVHTHDSNGEIHIEGPCVRGFTSGDFFDIWGKEFDSSKIFDKTTENGTLRFLVDGQENSEYRNLILRDDQNILIEYTSNNA